MPKCDQINRPLRAIEIVDHPVVAYPQPKLTAARHSVVGKMVQPQPHLTDLFQHQFTHGRRQPRKRRVEFARKYLRCRSAHRSRADDANPASGKIRLASVNRRNEPGCQLMLILQPLFEPFLKAFRIRNRQPGDCIFDFSECAHARRIFPRVRFSSVFNRVRCGEAIGVTSKYFDIRARNQRGRF